MKKKKLIFIGGIRLGGIPLGGETAKNQILLKYFSSIYDKIIVIDTLNWRKRPWVIIKILIYLFIYHKTPVFISASTHSVVKLCNFIGNNKLQKNVFFSVIGGQFHEVVRKGEVDLKKIKRIHTIMVESELIRQSVLADGFTNVIRIPNFKFIENYPIIKRTNKTVKFVFISRITDLKGCDLIFDSAEILLQTGYHNRFEVMFYGKIADDYKERFEQRMKANSICKYKGVIDLTKSENYDELAQYDVMLFPTFWPGEGFPGVLVDAFIAALPIVASSWHCNSEIVTNEVNGLLIPPKDSTALAEKMRYLIDNPQIRAIMSQKSRQEAAKYDIRNIYTINFMKELEMI